MTEKMPRMIKRGDIIIFICIAAVAGMLALAHHSPGRASDGLYAEVRVGGEVAARLPLDQDARYDAGAMTVVISGGGAHVEDSACPDKLCERMGVVRRPGETIVCLPARITVTVVGAAPDVDGVAY